MRIQDALQSLRPKAEWVMRGDSYEDLEWLDTKQSKPSQAEVESKMQEELLESNLIEKLASLGINADDLKALLL